MKMLIKNKKGFTLIELLAVIVLLAIIAFIGYTVIGNVIQDSAEAGDKQSVIAYSKAVDQASVEYYTEHFKFPDNDWIKDNVEIANSKVECDDVQFNIDDDIILNGCTVNNGNHKYCFSKNEVKECNKGTAITKLYGNSIQNGIPSPSNPVAIESVGDRTNNLFDINSGFAVNSLYSSTVIEGTNIIIPYSKTNNFSAEFEQYIPVEENETYTISFDLMQGGARILIRMYDETKTIINENLSITGFTYLSGYQGIYADKKQSTVSFPSRVKYIRFCTVSMNTQADTPNIYKNFQFIKGNVATEYEPYGKYKIPIKVSGKNLFDGIFEYGAINANTGVETAYNSAHVNIYTPNYISVKPNTEYVMTNGIANINQKVRFYDINKNYIGYSYKSGVWLTQASKNHSLVQVAKTPDNAYYVRFELDFNDQQTATDVLNGKYPYMLELGTTATEYAPGPSTINIYLDEPLRKVGDYADYIDFTAGILTRNIAIADTSNIVLASFKDYPTLWYGYASSILPGAINSSFNKIQSNKFKTIYPRNVNNLGTSHLFNDETGWPSVVYYNILKTDCPSVTNKSELQTWLRNLKAEIHYILEKPIETEIDLFKMSDFSKYTNFSVDTNVAPSNVDIGERYFSYE